MVFGDSLDINFDKALVAPGENSDAETTLDEGEIAQSSDAEIFTNPPTRCFRSTDQEAGGVCSLVGNSINKGRFATHQILQNGVLTVQWKDVVFYARLGRS